MTSSSPVGFTTHLISAPASGDFVAVMDRLEVDRAAVVGISVTDMTAIRFAQEQPERVSHLILVGGWVDRVWLMRPPSMH